MIRGVKKKAQRGASFLELQIAVIIFVFTLLGLGTHFQSLSKQTKELWNFQSGQLDIFTPFTPCPFITSPPSKCSFQSKVITFEMGTNGLETTVDRIVVTE